MEFTVTSIFSSDGVASVVYSGVVGAANSTFQGLKQHFSAEGFQGRFNTTLQYFGGGAYTKLSMMYGFTSSTATGLYGMGVGVYDYAENIPNMSEFDVGYGIGYGAEKFAEIALISRGASIASNGIGANSSLLRGGKTFEQFKLARGGTQTLAKIPTSTGIQRIITELHHAFLNQRLQKSLNLPNWLINNRLNVWKLNTVQHSLIDRLRYYFLRKGFKSRIEWFNEYNWFSNF